MGNTSDYLNITFDVTLPLSTTCNTMHEYQLDTSVGDPTDYTVDL